MFTVVIYTNLTVYSLLLIASLSSLAIVTLRYKRKECFIIIIPTLFAVESISAFLYFIIKDKFDGVLGLILYTLMLFGFIMGHLLFAT